jgi:hypothetical protein
MSAREPWEVVDGRAMAVFEYRSGMPGVTWEIEPVGSSCCLRVIDDELAEGANPELFGGWPMILSGLKALLETGEALDTPGSLRYADATNWSG